MTAPIETLVSLIAQSRDRDPSHAALAPVNGRSVSYAELAWSVDALRAQARQLGLQPEDRVAMALPDGLDAAVAFLGLASTCGLAPFNPRLTRGEVSRSFADLRPKALVVLPDSASEAIAAADDNGLPVWLLTQSNAAPENARGWSLSGSAVGPSVDAHASSPQSRALLLFTSGTTSKAKLVGLSQANLCASARQIAGTLALSPTDRCLNVMPLFHIHGLVAGLLSSLAAGATVVCTPGFDAASMLQWLEDYQPTWYTAVPTMHMAVLNQTARRSTPVRTRLRFIRSSSSALPPQTMDALESTFGAPVIEAYGMTEASHQMASNPLPPARRKAGTVGLSAGAEIAILHMDRHEVLPQGAVGEIVVRGPGVTTGYVENPAATAAAFTNGWFRTGDQGSIDEDGYLTITGRIKELINRGGEKIAPREIDEVLTAHPAVAQAVAFAVPDARLGEDVAAAVVLRPGASASPGDLRRHIADRLAYFKVPRHLLIVDALPTGPTGKLQRRLLAKALGLDDPTRSPAPEAEASSGSDDPAIERHIAELWRDVIGCDLPGVDEAFLDAGGDSIGAIRLANRLQAVFNVTLGLSDVFAAPTVREQARLIRQALDSPDASLR